MAPWDASTFRLITGRKTNEGGARGTRLPHDSTKIDEFAMSMSFY